MAYSAAVGFCGAGGESAELPRLYTAAIQGMVSALVLNDRADSFYYATAAHFGIALQRCVYRGLAPSVDPPRADLELRTALAAALAEALELKPSAPRFRWLASLFETTRHVVSPSNPLNGSSILAKTLWDSFTGIKDSSSPRHNLLQLGYRLELVDDFVAALAREYAIPFDHHVLRFLKATRLADANPSAAEEAIRLAHVVTQQAVAKIKPWRLLINSLSPLRRDAAGQCPCELSLESMTLERDSLLLQVSVRPSPGALVERLHLVVGEEGSSSPITATAIELLASEGPIAAERVIEIRVPLLSDAHLPDMISVPYVLTVESAQAEPYSHRDQWSRELRLAKVNPLPAAVLDQCWRGATGDPVNSTTHSYHGREREQHVLQRLLEGRDGRQGSAVIIGQRRIGKTSLLIETMQQYPPRSGHVCGIFCYFGGIQKKRPDESLSETVFHALTDWSGDAGGHNREVCHVIGNALGANWLRQLRRDLNPATSIASALGSFVERIAQCTGGAITRVAFFVDEFQSIFRFPRREVEDVMWALRPIVQMSPTISLVFAGSGLTRALVRGYDQAFFGSIETLALDPFCLDTDYEAIRDTFLPAQAREHLCPDPSTERPLVSCACSLCGGHPWFLSMLGYNAARILGGHPLTPVLLNEVCKSMIASRIDSGDRVAGAVRFYGHLFDSLDVVAAQKPHAQLLLANIARQVTMEWPWVTADQAISGPTLDKHRIPSGNRLDALRLLKDEDVLLLKKDARGAPEYRIRIPLICHR